MHWMISADSVPLGHDDTTGPGGLQQHTVSDSQPSHAPRYWPTHSESVTAIVPLGHDETIGPGGGGGGVQIISNVTNGIGEG